MAEKLAYSPLIEVLCEFRFARSGSWDWTIPGRLYDEIRGDFPERAQVDGVSVQFSVGPDSKIPTPPSITSPERVQMKRADGSAMVQVGPHLLVINHLQPYSDWGAFRPMIVNAFERHAGIVGPTAVVRIGLRYINKIPLPDSECPLGEITTLDPSREGPLNRPLNGMYQRFELKHDKPASILVLQTGTQFNDKERFLVLDFDIGSLPNEVFVKPTSLWSWLDDAHDRVGEAFLASIKPSLVEKWKRGER